MLLDSPQRKDGSTGSRGQERSAGYRGKLFALSGLELEAASATD